jgi:hypothetical protein
MKTKIQNVNFKSIDDFFDYLPENELEIVLHLRRIVLECIPNCKEKLSYNVPYYWHHSRVCFIWPSSITWGNVKTKGVRIGFVNGNLMRDEINFLEKENRKQVYVKDFGSIDEIDSDILKTYIFEALLVNEQLKKKK